MTRWIQADDFALGVGARLENVKLWDFEGSGSFQGSIVWQVYSNSKGGNSINSPGALLLSGTSTGLTHVATGLVLNGYAEFITTFDITPISLPAGVYWLALHNGPLSYTSDLGRSFWEATNSLGPSPSHSLVTASYRGLGPGTWTPHPPSGPMELAFQVNGIPGPRITSMAFMISAPQVSFTTTSGQTYRLEYKNSIADPGWTSVPGADAVSGTGNIVTVSDPDPNVHNLRQRFYRARLCPCQTIAGPSIAGFAFGAGTAPRISFTTVAGQLYRVEYKANLASALWTALPGAEIIGGTGQTIQIADNDPNISSVSRRFYRAVPIAVANQLFADCIDLAFHVCETAARGHRTQNRTRARHLAWIGTRPLPRGGNPNINQPSPTSTCVSLSTSRRKAQSASVAPRSRCR